MPPSSRYIFSFISSAVRNVEARFSGMSVSNNETTKRHIADGGKLHSHCRENLKHYIYRPIFVRLSK
jgi:hypothetical protein